MRRQILKQGGKKPCLRIVANLFTALTDQAGVSAHRAGAMERVQLLLEDWTHAHTRLADAKARMIAVLDELGLTALVTSIPGISAVGAAAIVAQTGDPHRFATARALVKHAGLAPREKLSGSFVERTKLTGPDHAGVARRDLPRREFDGVTGRDRAFWPGSTRRPGKRWRRSRRPAGRRFPNCDASAASGHGLVTPGASPGPAPR